jgi:hypothetical protein
VPRRALLACPKTNAAIFPRAFESSFTLRVIAVAFPYSEAATWRTCPKTYEYWSKRLWCLTDCNMNLFRDLGWLLGNVRTSNTDFTTG